MFIFYAMLQDSADESLFEAFYRKYNRLVFCIALEVMGKHDLAEECVQEVFINLARHFHEIKPNLSNEEKVENLIRVTTRNAAIDIHRGNKRHEDNVEDEDLSELYDVGEEGFDVCEQMILKEAIDSLPEEIKSIFYLKYVGGYSGSEIAKILDISEPLVRKRCMKGRQLAKKYLEKNS